MTRPGDDALEMVRGLKHQDPSDQATALGDATDDLLHTAPSIRAKLGTLSGAIVKIAVQGSDREVVLLALLAILADDIATLPDPQIRAKRVVLHNEVIRQLGMVQRDAEFFRQNLSLVAEALAR